MLKHSVRSGMIIYFLVATLGLFCYATTTRAAPQAIKTWTGAVSTDWETPSNWDPSGVPGVGEDCLIPAGRSNYPVLTSQSAACFGNLTVEANASITVGVGGSLWTPTAIISGTVTIRDNGYYDLNSTVWVRRGGTLSFSSDNPGMIFSYGGTLTVDGLLLVYKDFPVYGTSSPVNLLINPGGRVSIYPSGTLTVDGSFTNHGELWQEKEVPADATTSFLTITNLSGSETKYYGVDITLGSGASMGMTSVLIQGDQICPAAVVPLGEAVRRCYTLSPAQPRAATLKFYYRLAESNINPAANAYHFDGTTWDALPSTRGGSGEAMYVQAANVSSYRDTGGAASPFALKDLVVTISHLYLPLLVR